MKTRHIIPLQSSTSKLTDLILGLQTPSLSFKGETEAMHVEEGETLVCKA